MKKWVVLYGFGTASAYVDAVFEDEAKALGLLAAHRRAWGSSGYRFSVHDYSDVVAREKAGAYVLRPSVTRPRTPMGPQRKSEHA